MVYSRKPPVLRHGQHAQLNIEGDLPIKNGLAERVEGEIVRYRITPRGEEALGHLRELEKLMPEMAMVEEEIATG